MAKDSRFGTVKFLIESGHIKTIAEIFRFIPKTIVLKDFRINFGRFNNALADPSKFRLAELKELADLFGVEPKKFIEMAYEQSVTVRLKRKYIRQQKSNALEKL